MNHIGYLGEKSLHADLKSHYTEPGDQVEVQVGAYVIDVMKTDCLVEIQNRGFHALKKKLQVLLDQYPVCLVHPIPEVKWIVKLSEQGDLITRRKSPKRGRVIDAFFELILIPEILLHPNFIFEVVLVETEEHWVGDGKGSWRRKGWSITDHVLLKVLSKHRFVQKNDYLSVIPEELERPFTNRSLREAIRCRPSLAGRITYTLRKMDLIHVVGKKGNALLMDFQD